MWVCKKCGSKNIIIKQWINPNNINLEYTNLINLFDLDTWCYVCEIHTGVIKIEDK